jgi:hypothetical protein
MSLSPLDRHHEFYGTTPPREPEPEPDALAQERRRRRNSVARVFLSPEGAEALEALRYYAARLKGAAVDVILSDPARAQQFLIYREGRQDLIREIETMCEEDTR